MTTVNQVAKQIVESAIDMEYVTDCGKTTVGEVYQAEYGYNGLTPTACKDYLQGLPSVCTVPFWNNEILELLAKNGISRKSDDAQTTLIENYWYACGNQLFLLIKGGK
jgi:hypothetical protein